MSSLLESRLLIDLCHGVNWFFYFEKAIVLNPRVSVCRDEDLFIVGDHHSEVEFCCRLFSRD